MSNKLKLSDFLALSNLVDYDSLFVPEKREVMSFGLMEFYSILSKHPGWFEVDNIVYTSLIPSSTSMYFFKEQTNEEALLIFEPIIDIKKKDAGFTVFYYPDKIINILLKDSTSNVKEIKRTIKS